MIEKICAEIERQMKLTESSVTIGVLSDILKFIKSLRKEPIRQYISPENSTLGKLLKEMKDFSPEEDLGLSNEEYNNMVNELIFGEEKPVSNDLEKAAKDRVTEYGRFSVTEYEKTRIDDIIFGAEWQKEKMIRDSVEREVKVDAGGYPYIDATELYDYDIDEPLAKAGDKVKLIIIKEE